MKQHKTDNQISTVGQDDFPELEGKVIIVDLGGAVYGGLVVGCNRGVGVTIVNAEDRYDYLFCLRGCVAPGHIKGKEKHDKVVFEYTLQAIKDGVFNLDELQQALVDAGLSATINCGASAARCAYAQ
jgi:hypothetical protein